MKTLRQRKQLRDQQVLLKRELQPPKTAQTQHTPVRPYTQTPEKLNFRTWESGPLIYEVYREIDPHDSPGAPGDPTSDKHRIEAFKRDEWCYMGVVCEIRVKTPTNWAIPHCVGRASLWGIESDSEARYFLEVEGDMIREAEEDVRRTIAALQQCTNRL